MDNPFCIAGVIVKKPKVKTTPKPTKTKLKFNISFKKKKIKRRDKIPTKIK